MSELEDKYEKTPVEKILADAGKCKDKKQKADIMRIARNRIAADERQMREDLKKDNEDGKKEKELLRKTHSAFMEQRKVYLKAYRDMNSIINTKSMLKHFDDFNGKAKDFMEHSAAFVLSLQYHLENLDTVKNGGKKYEAKETEDDTTVAEATPLAQRTKSG